MDLRILHHPIVLCVNAVITFLVLCLSIDVSCNSDVNPQSVEFAGIIGSLLQLFVFAELFLTHRRQNWDSLIHIKSLLIVAWTFVIYETGTSGRTMSDDDDGQVNISGDWKALFAFSLFNFFVFSGITYSILWTLFKSQSEAGYQSEDPHAKSASSAGFVAPPVGPLQGSAPPVYGSYQNPAPVSSSSGVDGSGYSQI